MKQCNNGTMYVVATPIGNMGDITLRAIETLKSVSLVVCEDTRVTGSLLSKLNIKKPLLSLHQHSGEEVIGRLVDRLIGGEDIAYVTDSGTPGISDPGNRLVEQIRNPKTEIRNKFEIQNSNESKNNETMKQRNHEIRIIPIPGPSAVTAAISVSGMVEKEFYFAGFLPKKKGRETKLGELSKLDVPIVIYESAFRLEKTLNHIKKHFGSAEVFIAREMTKMFEEYWGGEIDFVLSDFKNHKIKGEVVLIVKSL